MAIAEQLTDRGYQVEQVDTGEAALARLADFAFDIIITDLRLPGVDGSAVVEGAVGRYPDIIAIVVTGYGTVKDAVEAIKRGAWDFVNKPFQIDELLHVLDSAIEQRRLKSENAYLRAQLEKRDRFEGVVGRGQAMSRLFQLLETVAPTSSTILITGETGTGKEVVARAIHQGSPRRLNRFVALNCSAIPETLLEAELFGHVRGAFTGATGNRQGRLEQAHKGTLFLDEVGTMSAALQMKLLRVLQEGEARRVGDTRVRRLDVRIVSATHRGLEDAVAAAGFRADLFFRLNAVRLRLPPLRERGQDVVLLARHYLARAASPHPRPEPDPGLVAHLLRYPWPGNVRELANACAYAVRVAGAREVVALEHWPEPALRDPRAGLGLHAETRALEERRVREALTRTRGNKTRAARSLGLSRQGLLKKLRRFGMLDALDDADILDAPGGAP
jgi:DNA-binding NtrC family response regulator